MRLGTTVALGEPLYTVHSESPGELAYAFEYLEANADIIRLDQA